MATGEKATFRLPAPFDHVRLDVYPYFPPVNALSGASLAEIDKPLPFLLYLHDGVLPFHTGSRIDASPQVVAWCRARGVPFLSLDYTLLSSPPAEGEGKKAYALEDVWESVEACWRFINNLPVRPAQDGQGSGSSSTGGSGNGETVDEEETLRWQITATGHGAETDTGTVPLIDDWREFQPRGLDGRAGLLWGSGAGAFLASLGAARLHPPPIAVVLERPLLNLDTGPLAPLPPLPETVRRPPLFPYTTWPSFSGVSDRLWLEGTDANEEEAWRNAGGMDTRRPLAGERDSAQALRMAIDAFEAGRRRGDTLHKAFSQGRIPASSSAALQTSTPINQPFPPTLILTNLSPVAQSEAQSYLATIRHASPEGALADDLLSGTPASKATTGTQRYLHLALDDASSRSIPLLQGRMTLSDLPPPIFRFLGLHLADALAVRAAREGVDSSGVVEGLRRAAGVGGLGVAKL